jgi:transcriptional regulator with XRE-family HTH domain
MRNTYLRVLKPFFQQALYRARKDRGLSQAKAAELLVMDVRSYADLEHGVSMGSALTLLLFLLYLCPDPAGFMKEVRTLLEEVSPDREDAQTGRDHD